MSAASVAPVDALAEESRAQLSKQKPLDINRYATKKTVAQGMMDIALLTANASQLKYLLHNGDKLPFYTLVLWMISASICLQIGVGGLFLIIGGLNINKKPNQRKADLLNDITVVLIFLTSTLNVIISSFGLSSTSNVTLTRAPSKTQ